MCWLCIFHCDVHGTNVVKILDMPDDGFHHMAMNTYCIGHGGIVSYLWTGLSGNMIQGSTSFPSEHSICEHLYKGSNTLMYQLGALMSSRSSMWCITLALHWTLTLLRRNPWALKPYQNCRFRHCGKSRPLRKIVFLCLTSSPHWHLFRSLPLASNISTTLLARPSITSNVIQSPSTRHPTTPSSARINPYPNSDNACFPSLLSLGFVKAMIVPNPAIIATTNKMINLRAFLFKDKNTDGPVWILCTMLPFPHGETCYGMNLWHFFFPDISRSFFSLSSDTQLPPEWRFRKRDISMGRTMSSYGTTKTTNATTLHIRNRVRLQGHHSAELPLPTPHNQLFDQPGPYWCIVFDDSDKSRDFAAFSPWRSARTPSRESFIVVDHLREELTMLSCILGSQGWVRRLRRARWNIIRWNSSAGSRSWIWRAMGNLSWLRGARKVFDEELEPAAREVNMTMNYLNWLTQVRSSCSSRCFNVW